VDVERHDDVPGVEALQGVSRAGDGRKGRPWKAVIDEISNKFAALVLTLAQCLPALSCYVSQPKVAYVYLRIPPHGTSISPTLL
jgi:hypothetical protein